MLQLLDLVHRSTARTHGTADAPARVRHRRRAAGLGDVLRRLDDDPVLLCDCAGTDDPCC